MGEHLVAGRAQRRQNVAKAHHLGGEVDQPPGRMHDRKHDEAAAHILEACPAHEQHADGDEDQPADDEIGRLGDVARNGQERHLEDAVLLARGDEDAHLAGEQARKQPAPDHDIGEEPVDHP